MMRIHDKKVNKIDEFNILHDIINPSKPTKNEIVITLLYYMDVLIIEKVKQSLRTFESYWTVDVVPRL